MRLRVLPHSRRCPDCEGRLFRVERRHPVFGAEPHRQIRYECRGCGRKWTLDELRAKESEG